MPALSRVPAGVIEPVRRKAAEIIAATGSRVTHVWGYNVVPDHNNKRCVDFMVRSVADGDVVADYVRRNAKRLGVNGIIWNRRVMGFPSNGPTYRGPEGQWRPYGGPSPHTDHPHVEFNASAYRAPDGGAAPPIGSGAAPNKPQPKDWFDMATQKDLEKAVRAVLNEELIPTTDHYPASKKGKRHSVLGVLRRMWAVAERDANSRYQRDRKDMAALKASLKALGKKVGLSDSDLDAVQKAAETGAEKGAGDALDEMIDGATVTLEVKE